MGAPGQDCPVLVSVHNPPSAFRSAALRILEELKKEGIGERTIHQVKKQLEIRSVKRDTAWYWLLPESESGR